MDLALSYNKLRELRLHQQKKQRSSFCDKKTNKSTVKTINLNYIETSIQKK